MWVILKRDLFVGANLYKAVSSGTEIPDFFRDQLPKDAVIMDGPVSIAPVATDYTRNTAKALDEMEEADKNPPPNPPSPVPTDPLRPKALSELDDDDLPLPPKPVVVGKAHDPGFKPSNIPHKSEAAKKFDDK